MLQRGKKCCLKYPLRILESPRTCGILEAEIPGDWKIDPDQLPIHYAKKHIHCIDENGSPDKGDQLNAYKLEYLITDLIALMKTCLPFEVERKQEFAPLKNRTGSDSIDSAREMLLQNGYDL